MRFWIFLLFFLSSCARQQSAPINLADALTDALIALPQVEGSGAYPSVEVQKEAALISKALVDQTRETNKDFRMSGGPKWHNFKIKMGVREKGYCYEWVPELLKALPPEPMQYYERHWGGSFMSMGRENNAVIITKRGALLETGIVYDAWRGVGKPFWIPVAQDKKYQWVQRFNETQILAGEAKVEPK